MKRNTFPRFAGPGTLSLCSFAALCLCAAAFPARADLVEMQNGDRYVGHVVSLDAEKLVLQSEVLGNVNLPRPHVTLVSFGNKAITNLARSTPAGSPRLAPAPTALTNSNSDLSRMLRQLGSSTNLIQQVERQFLGDAGPEAKDKFNELLGGLMTGKLNVDDIRAQASSAADQIRALKKDLGNDAGWTLDAYLGILDRFLKETAPPVAGRTNSAPQSTE
jgi:hypothetical protein